MNKYEPCNICGNLIEEIAKNFKDLPRPRALSKALSEFQLVHEDGICVERFTCMPIQRAVIELKSK